MSVHSFTISRKTKGHADMHDLTEEVESLIQESGLTQGIACVFAPGSTCGITTIEFEPGCLADFRRVFDEIIPSEKEYQHHLRWGDGNGHSHVRSALLGPSLSFPFEQGKPLLGTWQQIIFVDFDNRSRTREIVLQLVGE
jgi:secondary thiamine-phosphate synthase enzyme